ncbi:MAG: S16 family serine protease [Polyangiales bacterium]
MNGHSTDFTEHLAAALHFYADRSKASFERLLDLAFPRADRADDVLYRMLDKSLDFAALGGRAAAIGGPDVLPGEVGITILVGSQGVTGRLFAALRPPPGGRVPDSIESAARALAVLESYGRRFGLQKDRGHALGFDFLVPALGRFRRGIRDTSLDLPIVVACLSSLLQRAVPPTIYLTGEVSSDGTVSRVGGVERKLDALIETQQRGLQFVCPGEKREGSVRPIDLGPDAVERARRAGVEVVPVRHLDEVLRVLAGDRPWSEPPWARRASEALRALAVDPPLTSISLLVAAALLLERLFLPFARHLRGNLGLGAAAALGMAATVPALLHLAVRTRLHRSTALVLLVGILHALVLGGVMEAIANAMVHAPYSGFEPETCSLAHNLSPDVFKDSGIGVLLFTVAGVIPATTLWRWSSLELLASHPDAVWRALEAPWHGVKRWVRSTPGLGLHPWAGLLGVFVLGAPLSYLIYGQYRECEMHHGYEDRLIAYHIYVFCGVFYMAWLAMLARYYERASAMIKVLRAEVPAWLHPGPPSAGPNWDP